MAKFAKIGYGQVEPNRLTAQKTREVFGQLPADAAIKVIENGMGLVYDQKDGKVKFSADGSGVCLVMNEIVLTDPMHQQACDYAMSNANGTAYPRLYALHVGDTFTTNTVMDDCVKGVACMAGADGYWKKSAGTAAVEATVIDVTTLPDGQKAVKFVVTKAEA